MTDILKSNSFTDLEKAIAETIVERDYYKDAFYKVLDTLEEVNRTLPDDNVIKGLLTYTQSFVGGSYEKDTEYVSDNTGKCRQIKTDGRKI